MKKKLVALIGIMLLFGGVVAINATNEPLVVHAEEETTEIKEYLNQKYDDLMNKQILGASIGALIGGLGTVVVGLLTSKSTKIDLNKALELARSNERIDSVAKKAVKDAQELVLHIDERTNLLINKYEEMLAYKDSVIEELKEQNKVIEEEANKQIKTLLTVCSNTKELVANGMAEILNKEFGE